MNANEQDPNDLALSRVLKSWNTDAPLPPGFQEHVWQRISLAERPAYSFGTDVGRWWQGLMRKPAFAVAYLVFFLAVGASTGYWRAEHYAQRTQQAWRAAYVQSVTPVGFNPSAN